MIRVDEIVDEEEREREHEERVKRVNGKDFLPFEGIIASRHN